eukprot:g2016.t1
MSRRALDVSAGDSIASIQEVMDSRAFKTPRRQEVSIAKTPEAEENESNKTSKWSRGVAKMTRKMFYKRQYDDSEYKSTLRGFKSIQPELLKLPKLAMNFVKRVRDLQTASLNLSKHFERLNLDGLDPDVQQAGATFQSIHPDLFSPEMEQMFSEWILSPVTRFHAKVEDCVPRIETSLKRREEAFYELDVKKQKYKKTMKQLDAARARALKKWKLPSFGPSIEELETEIKVRDEDVQRANEKYQEATRILTEELMHVKARHALMMRAEISGMLKTYRMLHDQADGLCREVASKLPSVKKLTENYTDRLENWESRVVKRDFSYQQQGSSRKVWQDVRESSEKELAKKRASTSRKSRRKSILYGSKPVVVPVFGGPLPISMGNLSSKKPSEQMPAVVRQCAKFIRKYGLKVEGIFRIPGDMQLVSKLQHLYNLRKPVNLVKEVGGEEEEPAAFPDSVVYTVATLLKSFFRSLKCPLLSSKDMDRLQSITQTQSEGPALNQALRTFMDEVQSPNRQVLRFLIRLLHDITVHKDVNRMGADNLAVCFTPSLAFEPTGDQDDDNDKTSSKRPLDPTETMLAFAKLKPAMEAITKLLQHGTNAIGKIPLMSTQRSVLEISESLTMTRTNSMDGRLKAAGVNMDEPTPVSPTVKKQNTHPAIKKKEPSQHALSPSHHLTLKGIRENIQAAPPTIPPPKEPAVVQGAGTRWKVVFRNGVAYRSVYGDLKSRVLHVPGPIQRDVVTALEVRNDWIRVQQRHGDEMYWLPTQIQGLGTILECVSGDDDAVVATPPAPVTEEKKDDEVVKDESVVLSPSVKTNEERNSSRSDVVVEKKEEEEEKKKEEIEGENNKGDSALDMAYPDNDDDDDDDDGEMEEPPPAIPKRAEPLPEQW